MERAYYLDNVEDFIIKDTEFIFGKITYNDQYEAGDLQKNSWKIEIEILKRELADFRDGYILFEYTIPRIGSRVDAVLLYNGIVFLLEFKVGEKKILRHAVEQVIDYALDLNCFHEESRDKLLVPMLVSTDVKNIDNNQEIKELQNNILDCICCNCCTISYYIKQVCSLYHREKFNPQIWINSSYKPTPTIIEAAQALYNRHNVKEISRSDASVKNLNQTTCAVNNIIDKSKEYNKKSICFITGVPGAGKTLAGLNIAVNRQKIQDDEHAVFLSGNGPLVDVLQEALARDSMERKGIKKTEALRETKAFIQIIHHFRDDAITTKSAPNEKVAIFDEAQRAWDEENLTAFMKKKKGIADFNMSEPEFLIDIMNRHKGWCVIVCLIGGGQEINKGESAGICGWLETIKKKYQDWDIYISSQIKDEEYLKGADFQRLTEGLVCEVVDDLHLSVSLRSFRSEKVSEFVKAVLDCKIEYAKELYMHICENYPIFITRNLETDKQWVRDRAKGSQRYGMTSSSGAKRLRKFGVWVQSSIHAPTWFLNDKDDVRSSYFLEEVATEFDIQGLELDWTIVCWDANLRFINDTFEYYKFLGTKWCRINKQEDILYLKNAYRVLLTRARQGFVVFIPQGNNEDMTMRCDFYNRIYKYFKDIGIKEI